MRESDKAALNRQREANRAAQVEDVVTLAEYVMGARHQDKLSRTRIFGVPVVPGGRLWQMIVLALDHDAVFRRCLAGEYESVTAAGRDAGLPRTLPRRRIELGRDSAKSARSIHAALDAGELGVFLPELIKQAPKRAAKIIFDGLDEREWRTFARELAHLETIRERSRRPARSPWGKRRSPHAKGSRVY